MNLHHFRLPFRLDPNTFSALKSRNFTLFLAGQSAAMTGVWVQKLANSWLVYRLTESPLKLGLVELLANAPIFIVGLLAGAYLEQHDKRKTLMVTQFLTMLHAVIMAILVLTNTVNYYLILILSLYLGIVSAIDMPARQSSILLMVESRKTLKSALSLQSMTFNLSRLIGPSIAGFIVYYAGEGLCFLLTAVLYLPVLYVLYTIRFNEMPHDKKKHNMINDVAEGLKYVKNFYSLKTLFIFLAIFGYLTTWIAKIRMRFVAVFNMAVYSLTLSTILNMIYIAINIFVPFTMEYFQVMYVTVAAIYLIAAIFLLKSEYIKRQAELMKLAEAQEIVKKELEEKEEEEKEKEEREKEKKERKEKDKKEEKKDEKQDGKQGGEPQGSGA